MADQARPYRSALYIPGSRDRALDKARGLPADAIIFDLEDAVAADEKAKARALLVHELTAGGYGQRARIVRVNGLATEWGADDVAAIAKAAPDAILLPKVGAAADLDALADLAGDIDLWAMIETPAGILHAEQIAAHPRLKGMVMGTNDLAKELDCRIGPGRPALQTSLQMALLAARAHGRICIDGVYNAFKDEDGLREECEQGRDMGFDGKTLIHPAQLAIANAVFAPSDDELDLARRHIAAFEEAQNAGQGVAVVDGRIVENLHIDTARTILARAAAITALEMAQ